MRIRKRAYLFASFILTTFIIGCSPDSDVPIDTNILGTNVMSVVGCLGWFIFQLLCWFFSAANHKNDLNPIVLTNELSVVVNGKEVKLPSGLVLYPLNDLECCPEVNDGREYKIYVDSSLLQSRELESVGNSGDPDLIYRIEK